MIPAEKRPVPIAQSAAAAALGFASALVQLVLMRELLGFSSGNEVVLGIALGVWLLASGLGCAVGRAVCNSDRAAFHLSSMLAICSVLPLLQFAGLIVARRTLFLPGAVPGFTDTILVTVAAVSPYCLLSGLVLACASAAAGRAVGHHGISRIYVADTVGMIAGGLLFSFALAWYVTHVGVLCIAAAANLLGAILWLVSARQRSWLATAWFTGAVICVAAATAVCVRKPGIADVFSGSWEVLYSGNSPYGQLTVTRLAGQIDFFENGAPLASSGLSERAEEVAHYAMAQRPHASRVLIIGGAVSCVAPEVLKYPVDHVVCVELDPMLFDAVKRYMPENIGGERVRTIDEDGRRFIRHTRDRFDVIILAAPEATTTQINRFYTQEFIAEAARVLQPGGVLCMSAGVYANYIGPGLARVVSSMRKSLAQVFPHVLVLPASRVFFAASTAPLQADIAGAIAAARVRPRYLTRSYLDAALAEDRVAEVALAAKEPAAPNRDFSPVLYSYHLQNWVRQYEVRFALLQSVLVGLCVVCIVLFGRRGMMLFVAGFSASALQVVLLIGLQTILGVLYHQIGILFAVFMLGMAAGAALVERRMEGPARWAPSVVLLALAGTACGLQTVLEWIGAAARPATMQTLAGMMVWTAAFATGGLAGAAFSLAVMVNRSEPGKTASDVYTADFAGASLGALLASTLLLPVAGTWGVSLTVAGLCVLAAFVTMPFGRRGAAG